MIDHHQQRYNALHKLAEEEIGEEERNLRVVRYVDRVVQLLGDVCV